MFYPLRQQIKHFFPVFLKCDNSGLRAFLQLHIQFHYTGAAVHNIKMTFPGLSAVCIYTPLSTFFFAVSDHHHSTALYSHHHQAAMLQGAMSGPPGEARASSTSSYTAIGSSSYPSAGPILSSQVSERYRPTLTNIRTDLQKIWYELICKMTKARATIHLDGSIFDIFSSYYVSHQFS